MLQKPDKLRPDGPVGLNADFTYIKKMVDYLSENTWTSRFSNGSSSKQFCAFLSQQNETFKGLIKGTGVPTTHNTNRGYMG